MAISNVSPTQLPDGNVTIRVHYSSLNYKDGLACRGHRGIIKSLPHVPGIDGAGVVLQSQSSRFAIGDRVIVTGNDLGQGRWGAWCEQIRVPDSWVVPLPENLTLHEAMIYGTAGFTAAQCVQALKRNHVTPTDGPVVVSGATGGVGTVAIKLLSHLGYTVVAISGKKDRHDDLRECGAAEVIDRTDFSDSSTRPMLSAKWAGGVDTVGGDILTTMLRSTEYGGCVTSCGLVASDKLEMTVYPFLLRGVSLCGIASADFPNDKRQEIWNLLAIDWKPSNLQLLTKQVSLEALPEKVAAILSGKNAGRVVVAIDD